MGLQDIDLDAFKAVYSNIANKPKLFCADEASKEGLPKEESGSGVCNMLAWCDDNTSWYFAIGVRFTGRLDEGGVFARLEVYNQSTEEMIWDSPWAPVTENPNSASNPGVICVNLVNKLALLLRNEVDEQVVNR